MAADTFLALAAFAFVTSITPGPNNFMLLASGANFGFARTIPHMFGISAGFASLLLGVGFGLGALLETWPALHLALKVAGGGYLLYLAWKIATNRSMGDARAVSRPLSFLQAAAFQWVNPKAWMMAVTAMILFTDPATPRFSVVLVAVAFVLVNLPSVSVWTGFGTVLKRVLSSPDRLKWFNIAMGVLLAATLFPMVR